MRPRIKFIEPKRIVSFSEALEARARAIVRRADESPSRSTTTRSLERQIALVLEQLDASRRTHAQVRDSLRRDEFGIHSELGWRAPNPTYKVGQQAAHDLLTGRLLRLKQEKRKIALVTERERRELTGRLLELLEQYRMMFGL